MSGVYSDPFLYPPINQLLSLLTSFGVPIGLYTNGTHALPSVVSDVLRLTHSYVVLHLPAYDAKIFSNICQCTEKQAAEALVAIDRNLSILANAARESATGSFRVTVQLHQSPELQRDDIVRLADKLCRLSTPVELRISQAIPTSATTQALFPFECPKVSPDFVEDVESIVRSSQVRIVWRLSGRRDFPVDYCRALFQHCVIRADGKVFPCCYTALPEYTPSHCMGDIRKDSFDDLTNPHRLSAFASRLVPSSICPHCSREDYRRNMRGVQKDFH